MYRVSRCPPLDNSSSTCLPHTSSEAIITFVRYCALQHRYPKPPKRAIDSFLVLSSNNCGASVRRTASDLQELPKVEARMSRLRSHLQEPTTTATISAASLPASPTATSRNEQHSLYAELGHPDLCFLNFLHPSQRTLCLCLYLYLCPPLYPADAWYLYLLHNRATRTS